MSLADLEKIPQPNERKPEEVIIKGALRFDMMRYLEEEHKYVIIGTGKVLKKKRLFIWKSGIKGMEFGEYFIDPHEMFDDGKLKYDVNWCEPIDPKTLRPKRKKEVSLILAASKMAQRIKVATIITKFVFNKQYLSFFLISILIGAFSFLSLDPLLHLTPTTVVHWLNQPPRIDDG